jgi:hypothetical protein
MAVDVDLVDRQGGRARWSLAVAGAGALLVLSPHAAHAASASQLAGSVPAGAGLAGAVVSTQDRALTVGTPLAGLSVSVRFDPLSLATGGLTITLNPSSLNGSLADQAPTSSAPAAGAVSPQPAVPPAVPAGAAGGASAVTGALASAGSGAGASASATLSAGIRAGLSLGLAANLSLAGGSAQERQSLETCPGGATGMPAAALPGVCATAAALPARPGDAPAALAGTTPAALVADSPTGAAPDAPADAPPDAPANAAGQALANTGSPLLPGLAGLLVLGVGGLLEWRRRAAR